MKEKAIFFDLELLGPCGVGWIGVYNYHNCHDC